MSEMSDSEKSTLSDQVANFTTLLRAMQRRDVVLLRTHDRESREPVTVICAVSYEADGKVVGLTPLGKMFEGNPYEETLGFDEDPELIPTLVSFADFQDAVEEGSTRGEEEAPTAESDGDEDEAAP